MSAVMGEWLVNESNASLRSMQHQKCSNQGDLRLTLADLFRDSGLPERLLSTSMRLVCIQTARPLFGRPRTLNAAYYCAPTNTLSAGQQWNEQVASARDTVYGSEGQ
jgi:hypothetical protein